MTTFKRRGFLGGVLACLAAPFIRLRGPVAPYDEKAVLGRYRLLVPRLAKSIKRMFPDLNNTGKFAPSWFFHVLTPGFRTIHLTALCEKAIGIRMQVRGNLGSALRKADLELVRQAVEQTLPLTIIMPCGASISARTFDEIPDHDVPCPCGDPTHWLVKHEVLP